MNLGETIKNLRNMRKLRQIDLAEKIGVTREHLSLVERNQSTPTFALLNKIAKEFDISAAILVLYSMGKEDIPENQKEYFTVLHKALIGIVNDVNQELK